MTAASVGSGLERFRFLLRQYGQWHVAGIDCENRTIESSELHLTESRNGAYLAIPRPQGQIRGRIASLRLEKGGRCILRLQAGGRGEPRLFVLSPREAARLGQDIALQKEQFRKWIVECCVRLFPSARISRRMRLSATGQHDTSYLHSLLLQLPAARIAIVALAKDAGKAGVWSALSKGLNCWSVLRQGPGGNMPLELAFVVHRSFESEMGRLLRWLRPGSVPHRLYFYRGRSKPSLSAALSADEAPNPVTLRWPRTAAYAAGPFLQDILDSYGPLLRRFALPEGSTTFRFRGLDVLRSKGDTEELYFGPPDFGTRLTERSRKQFEAFMQELARVRAADSRERQHPYYRWQAERWLEEAVLCDIERLDPQLEAEWVYSQIPAYRGEGRAVLDMLAVTGTGRLVVVEVKVNRDPDFLVQALDYWDLVHRLNQQGEFQRRGFFEGVRLSKEKPLLYLVAPVFCFDRRLSAQAGLLDKSISGWKIAVAGSWRRRLRIVERKPLQAVD